MGNCVEALSKEDEADEARTTLSEEEKGEKMKGRMRIKVVLRKEELQWLMEQIEERGGKGLEELLEEIERGRKVMKEDDVNNISGTWRPSLHSIMECPQFVDPMER